MLRREKYFESYRIRKKSVDEKTMRGGIVLTCVQTCKTSTLASCWEASCTHFSSFYFSFSYIFTRAKAQFIIRFRSFLKHHRDSAMMQQPRSLFFFLFRHIFICAQARLQIILMVLCFFLNIIAIPR